MAQKKGKKIGTKIYQTTVNDNHWHNADLDLSGNGETTKVLGVDKAPHVHKIVKFEAHSSGGHKHQVITDGSKTSDAFKDIMKKKERKKLEHHTLMKKIFKG